MNKLIKSPETKNFVSIFLIFTGILFLSYSQFFNYRITSDHVPYAYTPMQWQSLKTLFSSGPFTYFVAPFITKIFEKLGQDNFTHTKLWQLSSILFYAFAATMMYVFIDKRSLIKNNFLLFLVVSFAFVNPYSIEFFVYHSLWAAMGMSFVVASVCLMFKKKFALTIILGYIAQQVYQTNIFICLIICIAFTFFINCNDNLATLIVKEIKNCLIIVSGPVLFTLQYTLYTMIFGAIAAVKDPLYHQGFLVRGFRFLKSAYKIYIRCDTTFFDPLAVFLFVLATFVFTLLSLFSFKEKSSKLKLFFPIVLYYLSVGLLSVIFFFLVDYYTVARVCIPVAFALSMFAMIMVFFVQNATNKILRYCAFTFLIVFSCYMYYKTQTHITDAYIGQAEDEFVVRMINDRIEDYSRTTGISINEIVTSKRGCKLFYAEQYSSKYNYLNYNKKIYSDEWSMGAYINLINGTDYKYRIMTEEEIEKYFNEDSLSNFDLTKQLVFDGQTAYWLAY